MLAGRAPTRCHCARCALECVGGTPAVYQVVSLTHVQGEGRSPVYRTYVSRYRQHLIVRVDIKLLDVLV